MTLPMKVSSSWPKMIYSVSSGQLGYIYIPLLEIFWHYIVLRDEVSDVGNSSNLLELWGERKNVVPLRFWSHLFWVVNSFQVFNSYGIKLWLCFCFSFCCSSEKNDSAVLQSVLLSSPTLVWFLGSKENVKGHDFLGLGKSATLHVLEVGTSPLATM